MKVYYPGPGPKTYHPQLGKLVTDEPFDLSDKEAKKYVDSGLLKKAQITKARKGESTKESQETICVFSAVGGCFRDKSASDGS